MAKDGSVSVGWASATNSRSPLHGAVSQSPPMHERSSEVLKTETDSPAVGFVSWLSFSVAPPNAGQRVYGGVKKKVEGQGARFTSRRIPYTGG